MVTNIQQYSEADTYYERPSPDYSFQDTSSQSLPLLQSPNNGTVYANQDEVFVKWLLDHKARTIIPLKMAWRGMEWSNEKSTWVPIGEIVDGKNTGRIMNEMGIVWAASLLESYFNPVFLATNMSVRNYNFRMREVSRAILMTLHERFREFDLLQSNIGRVAEEIESKISALLAGAINDGYRRWLNTQTHVQETKMYGPPVQSVGGLQSIFSRPNNGISQQRDVY